MTAEIFTDQVLSAIQSLIERHHTIYPRLPPQGPFFEAIVEQAFRLAGWPACEVIPTTPNSPQHDLSVGGVRLSIKSETGKATKTGKIAITKLCTTETGNWDGNSLVAHAIAHINRCDRMLMLRAIWKDSAFEYQLVEIPLSLLSRMNGVEVCEVGRRHGRRSFAADVMGEGQRLFRVHFDGADGKCQIHGLPVDLCLMLRSWEQAIL
jgi:type II restriction enzyme